MLIETDITQAARATFAPAPATAGWSPSPYVLVRLAGKPYAELERLKFAATVPLIERIIAGRAELARRRDELSDELFALIGAQAGDGRSRLVALRRDIFNGRPLSAAQRRGLRGLPRPLRARILGLARRERLLERLTARARAVFAAELAEKRALLQQSCRDEEFQKGLQVASQSVYEGLRKYLRADPAALRGRERRIEGGLFKYLMRMTAKTSPFSRFGPTGLAAYNPRAGRALSVTAGRPALVSRTELRLSVVAALADAVGLHPEIAPGLRPIVNPGAYESGGGLVVVQPFTAILRPGAAGNRRGAYPPAVRQLVEFVRRRPDLALRDLPAAYAAAAGLPEPAVAALVARLLDAGLLLNELRLPSDVPDRLASLRAALADSDHPVAAAVAAASLDLAEQVRAFGAAGAAERQGLLRSIRERLDGLLASQPLSQRVRADLNTLIVEDVGLAGVAVELGPGFFAPFIDELGALFECVFARDQGGLGYAWLRDTFVAEYGPGGRCRSLPRLVESLSQVTVSSLQAAFASGNFIPTDDDRPRVNAANQRLLTYLESLNRLSAADPGAAETRVPADLLRQLAALFGGVRGPASAALHLQVAAPDAAAIERGEHLVVLNYTLSGFGHFFTRYCDLFAGSGLDGQIQARIAALAELLPAGSEAAEVLSVLENNAQLHPPLTRRQIVPANERSGLPAADQIAPDRLELAHDAASDELHLLVHDDDGAARRLAPIYMGFFHPASLPLNHRLLADLSPTGYLPSGLRPSEFLPAALPGTVARPDLPAAIERHPRLRIGNFVLQRELWTVPVACAPAAGSGADDFEFFLERYAWAKGQGLPREVFVRGKRHFKSSATMTNVADVNKPLLLDIENFFAWKMIDQLLEDESLHTLFVEEMLPNPRQLFFQLDGQPFAAEFQIEFNREENPQ